MRHCQLRCFCLGKYSEPPPWKSHLSCSNHFLTGSFASFVSPSSQVEDSKTPEKVFEEKQTELTTTLSDLHAKRDQLTNKLEEVRSEAAGVDEQLQIAESDAEPFLQRRREFEELKAAAGPERVKVLEHLVETHDEMKKQEAEFKASCKEQLAHIRETLGRTAGIGILYFHYKCYILFIVVKLLSISICDGREDG